MVEVSAVVDTKKVEKVGDCNLKQLVALAMFCVLDHISIWLCHESASSLEAVCSTEVTSLPPPRTPPQAGGIHSVHQQIPLFPKCLEAVLGMAYHLD